MIKLVQKNKNNRYSSFNCPLRELCFKYISNEGMIYEERYKELTNSRNGLNNYDRSRFDNYLQMVIECKKKSPNYAIIDDAFERKTKHVLHNKWGREIASANSWWGLIGISYLLPIGIVFLIMCIAIFISEIVSLF